MKKTKDALNNFLQRLPPHDSFSVSKNDHIDTGKDMAKYIKSLFTTQWSSPADIKKCKQSGEIWELWITKNGKTLHYAGSNLKQISNCLSTINNNYTTRPTESI